MISRPTLAAGGWVVTFGTARRGLFDNFTAVYVFQYIMNESNLMGLNVILYLCIVVRVAIVTVAENMEQYNKHRLCTVSRP